MRWFLVEAEKTAAEVSNYVSYLLDGLDPGYKAMLPVMPDGIVEEILAESELAQFSTAVAQLKPLSFLQARLCMLDRILTVREKLTKAQRSKLGLVWKEIIFNLPEAYRTARAFRGMHYRDWIAQVDQLTDSDRHAIAIHQERWTVAPRFCLILDTVQSSQEAINQSIISFNQQIYRNWVQASSKRIVPEDWYLFIKAGDQLSEHALYWFASEIIRQPGIAFVYSDDDYTVDGVRTHPRFKPAWSWLHLNETNYIGRAVAVSGHALLNAGVTDSNISGDQFWHVLLKIGANATKPVAHIPAVLYHQQSKEKPEYSMPVRRINYPLPQPFPLVSIIIPTRDASEILENCVKSVLEKTTYKNFEIILADNGSECARTVDLLNRLSHLKRVRWLRDFRPFNYSELNNAAAKRARGDILCFLNNDTEVLTHDWLDVMIGCLAQQDVGIVGAKLYFANDTVQHAGDVVGAGGCANHLHSFNDKTCRAHNTSHLRNEFSSNINQNLLYFVSST